ncbi:unnamed protein product [Meganyctiphanes norvegica]|uniref:Condensation domain-containing protein n=1 Tax=Meganyctiphanes norvegica TaxID=48144 RepID=A0AAV2PWF3_MEGNR
MSSFGDGWVRPASSLEEFMETCNRRNFCLIVYSVTLQVKNRLDAETVRQALKHLYRKVPTLRRCLQRRGDNLWWRDMDQENIDFKVLEAADFRKEYYSLGTHCYDSSPGPMWCARLITSESGVRCYAPELEDQFPQQYTLLLGFHHAMTDGTSNLKIIRYFLQILNSVIKGEYINDQTQLAEHSDGSQTIALKEEKKRELNFDLHSKAIKKSKFKDLKRVPFLLKAFPPPTGVTPCTLTMTRDLDQVTSSKFFAKCKAEGVSVHAGFCAMINAAIVDILNEKGFQQEVYHIYFGHAVNSRRYWKGDTSKALGCHMEGLLLQTIPTSRTILQDIWGYARTLYHDMTTKLNNGAPLEDSILVEEVTTEDSSIEVEKGISYCTTNIGKIDSIIPCDLEHVQMTRLERTTSIHKFGSTSQIAMQTFRGCFMFGLDYCPNKLSTEAAKIFADRIIRILQKQLE